MRRTMNAITPHIMRLLAAARRAIWRSTRREAAVGTWRVVAAEWRVERHGCERADDHAAGADGRRLAQDRQGQSRPHHPAAAQSHHPTDSAASPAPAPGSRGGRPRRAPARPGTAGSSLHHCSYIVLRSGTGSGRPRASRAACRRANRSIFWLAVSLAHRFSLRLACRRPFCCAFFVCFCPSASGPQLCG